MHMRVGGVTVSMRKSLGFLSAMFIVLAFTGCNRRDTPATASRELLLAARIRPLQIGATTSYYLFPGPSVHPRPHRLPAIIFIGHPAPEIQPATHFALVADRLSEPAILIWSGLLDHLSANDLHTPVDDDRAWQKNSQRFPELVGDYLRRLPVDPDRVYLTGFSSSGVHAWMLAYDRPDLYAGVVALSAPAYPRQIQDRLQACGALLVTVVVRADEDLIANEDALDIEKRTGAVIETLNPDSRWILKRGETHAGVKRYWPEWLNYILRFSRTESRRR